MGLFFLFYLNFWVRPLPGVIAGFDMNKYQMDFELSPLLWLFFVLTFSALTLVFTMPAIVVTYFYGTFCVLSHYTTLPLVRLLQFPAVQCCCNFLADFGWKGRLVSIPMVDRDRIFLLYLLYHYFPILVRCCHMPVWLEGYMLICWVRLERLAHG